MTTLNALHYSPNGSTALFRGWTVTRVSPISYTATKGGFRTQYATGVDNLCRCIADVDPQDRPSADSVTLEF